MSCAKLGSSHIGLLLWAKRSSLAGARLRPRDFPNGTNVEAPGIESATAGALLRSFHCRSLGGTDQPARDCRYFVKREVSFLAGRRSFSHKGQVGPTFRESE